jgi:ABC-2 type transport system ATP-binding protein
MLAGLLLPTAGELRVLGQVPFQRKPEYLRQITLVMGQRNQLWWDLPASDSFELHRAMFDIPEAAFRASRDELVALLELGGIIGKPVRNLSLGERMKCEIAAALLHQPRVLFLDEPTIGLDVSMQKRIREFIGEYNRRHGATVLLTSHYMADVEALAKRVIVIHHGRITYDGGIGGLAERFAPYKRVAFSAPDLDAGVSRLGEVAEREDSRVTLLVPRDRVAAVIGAALAQYKVADLSVEDPPFEDVVDRLFAANA